MYDAGKVIAGLIIFLIIVTFPVWYNVASQSGEAPELVYPENEKFCVAAKEYMKTDHMDLINQWRDEVVREGNRMYKDFKGRTHEKSLTKTCLDCHSKKIRVLVVNLNELFSCQHLINQFQNCVMRSSRTTCTFENNISFDL